MPIHFISGVAETARAGCPFCVGPATMATDMAAMLDEVRCLSRILSSCPFPHKQPLHAMHVPRHSMPLFVRWLQTVCS